MNRLRELRNNKGLTLDEFAKEVGIPKATLSRYERGDSNPKRETWQKLAEYFNTDVPYLQGWTDVENDERLHKNDGALLKAFESITEDIPFIFKSGSKESGFINDPLEMIQTKIKRNYEELLSGEAPELECFCDLITLAIDMTSVMSRHTSSTHADKEKMFSELLGRYNTTAAKFLTTAQSPKKRKN